ncbi:MAG TPA: FkbM family methyltransferase [Phenylobacterium sp.]|jgi:FkbM family methyltransferase
MFKSVIMKSPLYPAARSAYQAVFKRASAFQKERMGAFYSSFFLPGMTVFDVGANQGEYSEIFAREGARVIAIEPNTAFEPRLTALSRMFEIKPVFTAIAEAPGEAELNVCSTPGYSTLVDRHADWIETSPDYVDVNWTHTLKVPVTTLDNLAKEFGEPEYVKIDVEGFELNVLRGMSFAPRYLSFEFGARRKGPSFDCLENLGARGYRFRPIVGRNYRFATPEWMDLAEAKAWLEGFSVDQAEYGDMFAHRLSRD